MMPELFVKVVNLAQFENLQHIRRYKGLCTSSCISWSFMYRILWDFSYCFSPSIFCQFCRLSVFERCMWPLLHPRINVPAASSKGLILMEEGLISAIQSSCRQTAWQSMTPKTLTGRIFPGIWKLLTF